jgi:hypothetical protein
VRDANWRHEGITMIKSITGSPRTVCAISAAAATAIAGLMVLLTSAAPDASAAPAIAVQQAQVKGDRHPNRISGSACSSFGWPNYEQSCQFDLRGPARTVRIIALR